jgi:hypothetical protein
VHAALAREPSGERDRLGDQVDRVDVEAACGEEAGCGARPAAVLQDVGRGLGEYAFEERAVREGLEVIGAVVLEQVVPLGQTSRSSRR